MELNELARMVNDFIQSQGGYWKPAWMLAALIEELGELSRALQVFHNVREKKASSIPEKSLDRVEEECGDILFALLCLTNSLDINLEEKLLKTLEKYKIRDSVF